MGNMSGKWNNREEIPLGGEGRRLIQKVEKIACKLFDKSLEIHTVLYLPKVMHNAYKYILKKVKTIWADIALHKNLRLTKLQNQT